MAELQKTRQQTIALDFDRVLHSCGSGFTGYIPFDEPVPGAQEACAEILRLGYKIAIHTCRIRQPGGDEGRQRAIAAIRLWLKHWRFPREMWQQQTLITDEKDGDFKLYVDDRGLRFEGDWGKVLKFITDNPTLRSWNKTENPS